MSPNGALVALAFFAGGGGAGLSAAFEPPHAAAPTRAMQARAQRTIEPYSITPPSGMARLSEKIAFVTGGARRIGRAIVEKFVAEGALVTFGDVDERAGRQTEAELSAARLHADFCHVDITAEEDVRAAVDRLLARHGTLETHDK